MPEQTISDLLCKAEKDLEIAKRELDAANKRVSELDFLVAYLNGSKVNAPLEIKAQEQNIVGQQFLFGQSLVAPQAKSYGSGYAEEIKQLMLGTTEEFNVPGIVNAIMHQHTEDSEANYKNLSKKASNIANRLVKTARIEIVTKGEGRKPNIYKTLNKE